jgi:hypothetical protein
MTARIQIQVPMALALGLGLGCGRDHVATVAELADQACACKDAACAEKIDRALQRELVEVERPSRADAAKIVRAAARATECIRRLVIPPP